MDCAPSRRATNTSCGGVLHELFLILCGGNLGGIRGGTDGRRGRGRAVWRDDGARKMADPALR